MAITKLLLLILGVLAQQYAVTPPNVRPPTEHLREQRGAERAIPWALASFKTLLYTWALLEASVLALASRPAGLSGVCSPTLAPRLPPALLGLLCASDPALPRTLSTLSTPTPAFVAGTALALAGALLRAHCFRALGARFTFELSIHPAHALVTHGVYGVVRHPSYTGVVGLILGWLLCVLDRRGVVVFVVTWASALQSEDGGGEVVMAALACMWLAAFGTIYVVANKRMDKEDAMLETYFGEEWRAWAKRVPCRLVPGLY